MRKFMCAIGVAAICMISGCAGIADEISMELSEETLTDGSAAIIVRNGSNYELSCGTEFVLERYEEEEWETLEADPEAVYEEIRYSIASGEEAEWMVDWKGVYGLLEPGQYRIVKEMQYGAFNRKSVNAHAVFSITESTIHKDYTFSGDHEEEQVSITVDERSLTQEGMSYVLSNESRWECTFGTYYYLEQKNGDAWQELPYAVDDEIVWHDLGYVLERRNGELRLELDWAWLYGELEPGEYRITKDMFYEDDWQVKYFVSAEFEITE